MAMEKALQIEPHSPGHVVANIQDEGHLHISPGLPNTPSRGREHGKHYT